MTAELTITTERIDDFPLLLETMKCLGLPEIIDLHLRRHGLHQGLSWGWIATIWLGHILSQSNSRKQPVQAWVRQAHETIERITGMQVNEQDFTDDRLTLLLRRLSKPETWQALETELGGSILRVYELKPERVRLDATRYPGITLAERRLCFNTGTAKMTPAWHK
jgi:transposase